MEHRCNICWLTGAFSIKCFYLRLDYSGTAVIAGANMSVTASHPSLFGMILHQFRVVFAFVVHYTDFCVPTSAEMSCNETVTFYIQLEIQR